MRKHLLPLLLSLTFAFILTGCSEETEDPPCAQDCASQGTFCNMPSGQCVPCLYDDHCDDGQRCLEAACVTDERISCQSDNDCQGTENPICDDTKRCAWDCRTDSDCNAPQRCAPSNRCIDP